ncbi:MAG: Scr1 family TA system antitoxin-like transcriptional regulator [Actinomycetota bacterium]
MVTESPWLARWELSLRLRDRRKHLGMDVKTITSALGFSRNYWSAVENNRTVLSVEKLGLLIDLFEFEPHEAEQLLHLRDIARHREWVAQYSAVLSDDMKRFYGLEAGAQRVEAWESMLITGLLQTEAYARATITSDPDVTANRAEQLVQVRLRRQLRLRGTDPVELLTVMSEAALWQANGGTEVLRQQLLHLLRVGEELRDTVEIRIVPFKATLGAVGGATRFIFHFSSPHLPTLAWQESMDGTESVEEGQERFQRFSVSNARALEMSLSREDSAALIAERADALA